MPDLDDELPLPQRLALAYAPQSARAKTRALLTLDARLAAILRGRREPIAAQLRLAWWRDMFVRPVTDWPRGEPVLEALRGWQETAALSGLATGWEALLAEELTPATIAEFAAGRGAAFGCLARELRQAGVSEAEAAGRLWAIADLAANLSDPGERALAVRCAEGLVPPPLPRALRPLAVLAGLGARALRRGGGPLASGPGSALLALRIGLAGQ